MVIGDDALPQPRGSGGSRHIFRHIVATFPPNLSPTRQVLLPRGRVRLHVAVWATAHRTALPRGLLATTDHAPPPFIFRQIRLSLASAPAGLRTLRPVR